MSRWPPDSGRPRVCGPAGLASPVGSRLGAIGAVVAFLLLVVAVFSPLIKTHNEDRTSTATFEAPSAEHLLGTDSVGRDIFSRIVVGTRLSLQVALISAFVGCGIGLVAGVTSAYLGGIIDLLVQRLIDGLIAFPAPDFGHSHIGRPGALAAKCDNRAVHTIHTQHCAHSPVPSPLP